MNSMIGKAGRILAFGHLPKIETKLKNAGIKMNAEKFTATQVMSGFVFSILAAAGLYFWFGTFFYALLGFFGMAIIYFIFILSLVGLFIDQRAKFVETSLPDALLLMASNLRSGIAPDEALILSAKTEFGFLSKNIKIAGHKIATGMPLEAAFKAISKNIESNILTQTIKLIIEGISSGGELASILEGTANDIKNNEIIRKEIRSMIFLYATFIFLAVAIISPVLYSVSIELASILSELSGTLASGFLSAEAATGAGSIPISAANISTDFLLVFAYVNISITAVFGSLMMALINKGNAKYGIKYIPFVLGLALLLFSLGRFVMNLFFGGIKIL